MAHGQPVAALAELVGESDGPVSEVVAVAVPEVGDMVIDVEG